MKDLKEHKIYTNDEREIVVTQQDIDDIMCAALEGGITFWCNEAEVIGDYLGEYGSDQISRDGTLRLHLIEPFDKDDTPWYDFTLEKFLKGLKMYLDDSEAPYDIVYDDGTNPLGIDTCKCDAVVADMIVEYGLWNEQVFC